MRFRVIFVTLALLVLSPFAFGQAYINFNYYFCPDEPAMSSGPCWQGTPIPNGGATIYIYEYPNTLLGPNGTFNGVGDPVYCGPGYFAGSPPITWYVGRQVYAVFEYQGCTYSTINHLWTTILYDNAVETTQDWWTCQCENPGCKVKEEQSSRLAPDLGSEAATVSTMSR